MQRAQPAVQAAGRQTQPAVQAAGRQTQPAVQAAGQRTQPAIAAAGAQTQPALAAAGAQTQPALAAAGDQTQPALAAASPRAQPAFAAEVGHRATELQEFALPPSRQHEPGQPPRGRYPSPSQPPPMTRGGLDGFPPPAPGGFGQPPPGYPQMNSPMQTGNGYPPDPYGARPSIPSLADTAARQVGDPGPQHGLGPLVGPQHGANLMSPVGPQYGQQVDWEQAAGVRTRALPTWVMIALFIGAIGLALTVTLVLARMMR